jgi:hypothetical protein
MPTTCAALVVGVVWYYYIYIYFCGFGSAWGCADVV